MVVARLGEIDPVERGKELVKDCPLKKTSVKNPVLLNRYFWLSLMLLSYVRIVVKR